MNTQKSISATETATGQTSLTTLRAQGRELPPRYGTKKDVANMICMSVRSVDNFCRAGMPFLRVSSRKSLFDMAEVRQWLSETYRTSRRAAPKAE